MCENVELKNVDISRIPVIPSVSNNIGSISTALTLSQNGSCTRDNFSSDDLLVKHSSSIKEMARKIRSLESKMKKFRRLKKKIDNNSCCHRYMNCKDESLLNPNLISTICKSMIEYYDEKREVCSKNKRDINSEKCACSMKKAKLKRRQQLKKRNACKNTFCKIENHNEQYQVRNMFCNETENAINILQREHVLSVQNNSFSDTNTFNTFLNDTDKSEKREFLHKKSILNSEVASIEDSLTTSRLSVDKIYASNNSLNEDDIEAIDKDNKTRKRISLSDDENSTDYTNDKIVNAEINKIKSKGQNIHEYKVDEIYANDNPLSKNNVEVINMGNQIETKTTFLCNSENSADHTDDKIDINEIKSEIKSNEKNEIKSKNQNIYKDKIGEIYTSDNLISNVNIKTMGQTETGGTSNNKNFTDNKTIDINAENIIKSKTENIHKDKIGEIDSRNNLNKNDVESIDMDSQTKNQIETETTFLPKNENFTDHSDNKIVDINREKNEIKSKSQIYEDKIDEIHASDNFFSKNDVEAVNISNQTKIRRTFLFKDKNSTDLANKKIIHINTEEDKIKRKVKGKVGDRILKKIRSLKRKTQANSCTNKQENIESLSYSDSSSEHNKLTKKLRIENRGESSDRLLRSTNLKRNLDTRSQEFINKQEDKLCSDDYKPAKKLRIAHTPKTSVPQLDSSKDFTHKIVKNIASIVTRKGNGNQQLDACTRRDNLLIESNESPTINKKCDEEKIKSSKINSIDRKPINKKDLELTSAKDCLQNNNITLSAINIERVSEFEKCDVLIKDTIDRNISMDRITEETSSNERESNVSHNNIANDAANDLELEESTPLRTCVTQSESSTLCKDSKYDKLTEALETRKPITELEHTYVLGNRSHDDHKISKDAISNCEFNLILHNQSNVSEATQNDSHSNSDVFTTEVLRSPRDSGIVVDYTNDNNMKEFLDEIKNNKQEETCANNETIEVQTIKTQEGNVCVSQQSEQSKEKSIDVSDKEEPRTPMSQLTKYIDQKHIKKHKLSLKQIKHICKMTGT